jgi:tetratricopeptide (TPR) repeat protein
VAAPADAIPGDAGAAPGTAAPADAGEPAPTAAEHATDTEAAEHVAQGRRMYLLGRYQEAIAEYRRAYELRADPQFLFDTAEAYRELGATEQALFYYKRYLAAAPRAPNRDLVEDRVAELEVLRERAPATALTPPPSATAKAKPRPLWRRWWIWTAVGVALAAGITAAALATRSSQPSVPGSDLGDHKFFY